MANLGGTAGGYGGDVDFMHDDGYPSDPVAGKYAACAVAGDHSAHGQGPARCTGVRHLHAYALRRELTAEGYGEAVRALLAEKYSLADAVAGVLGAIPRAVEEQIRGRIAS